MHSLYKGVHVQQIPLKVGLVTDMSNQPTYKVYVEKLSLKPLAYNLLAEFPKSHYWPSGSNQPQHMLGTLTLCNMRLILLISVISCCFRLYFIFGVTKHWPVKLGYQYILISFWMVRNLPCNTEGEFCNDVYKGLSQTNPSLAYTLRTHFFASFRINTIILLSNSTYYVRTCGGRPRPRIKRALT